MKYIISEQQHNKLIKLIENEINYQLDILKKMHDDGTTEDWVYHYAIDTSTSIDKIRVTSIDKTSDDVIIIRLDIDLNSVFIPPHLEEVFDSILSQIQPHFGKIYYRIDEINRPERNW